MHREPGKEAPAPLAGVSCCGCSACLLTLNPLKLEKEEAVAVVSFNDCTAEPPTAATHNPPPNPIPCTTACAITKTLPRLLKPSKSKPPNKAHSQAMEPEPTLRTSIPSAPASSRPRENWRGRGTTTHCLLLRPMRGRHQSVSLSSVSSFGWWLRDACLGQVQRWLVYVKESRWRGPREPAERPLPQQQFPSLESSQFQPSSSTHHPSNSGLKFGFFSPSCSLVGFARKQGRALPPLPSCRSRASASEDTSATPVWWESGGESHQVHSLVEGAT